MYMMMSATSRGVRAIAKVTLGSLAISDAIIREREYPLRFGSF
jgi:hypothetical protein